MVNAWLAHVKKTMKTMKKNHSYKKGMGLKQVISAAKKTYHKGKKHHGGEESDPDDEETPKPVATGLSQKSVEDENPDGSVGGRRRRRRSTGRTRRHRRR